MLPPIQAEEIFHLGALPVTNSMINAWIVAIVLISFSYLVKRKAALVPSGVQNAAEALVEFMGKQAEAVTGSRELARKFLPFAGSVFIIILLNNWLGLLPGTGSIGVYGMHRGHQEFLPLLRPAGADLNLTLAMAVSAIIVTNVLGVLAVGFLAHAGRFINLKGFAHAFQAKNWKDFWLVLFVGVAEFFVGIIEVISEIAKVLSLSLRLFGNIFAGEVLLSVIASLVAYFVPLPFMILELIVGIVQATVFSMLILVYATIASSKPH